MSELQPRIIGEGAGAPEGSPPPDGSRHWLRTVFAVTLVQAILSASFTIIAPVIPQLLPRIGVETAAGVRMWTGVLIGVTPLMASVSSPLWANIADRVGRKHIIAITGLGNAALAVLMAFAQNAPELLVLRLSMGCLSGFSAAGISLVAGSAPTERLGYALGWLATGQLVGALFGPMGGGLLSDLFRNPRAAFALTATLSLFAAALVLVLVERETVVAEGERQPSLIDNLSRVWTSRRLLSLFAALLFAQLAIRSADPVIVLRAEQLLRGSSGVAFGAGFAVSVAGLGNLVGSPFLGRRSDVIGHRRVLLISLLGAAALTFPQGITDRFPLFVAERFGVGLFVGGVIPTLNALVGRSSKPSERSSVFGVMSSATFLGGFLGPLTGGALAAMMGLHAAFFSTALLMLVAYLWVLTAVRRDAASYAQRR